LLTLFGLVAASLIVTVPSPVEAAQGDLQLVAQSFNVAADGTLTATLALPAKLADTDLSTADVVVTVYQRVDNRESLVGMIAPDGKLPRTDDTVTITPGCCAGPQPGQFTVSVPLEIAEVRTDALSLPRAGLYPITIAVVRNGKVLAEVLSFMNRLPAPGESSATEAMSVAVAIATQSSVHLDSNATVSLDSTTSAEMTTLADALETLTANKFPATVRIAPAVLNAMQAEPLLFSRLITALQAHQVVAEPQWPIDPSAAAAAQQDALYRSWWRDGQDRLAALGLGPAVISTSSILVGEPIGAAGASLRRSVGARLMVMSYQIYDKLDGTLGAYRANRGALVPAALGDGDTIDVAVVDHAISKLLAHPLATPEQTRIYAVANLLALRQWVETSGDSVQRHAVVIAAPDLGVPDPQLLGAITGLIAATPGLAAATVDDVGFRTDRLILDGQEQPVTLPTSDGEELQARVNEQTLLNQDIDAVASMLPDDDERPQAWRDLSALLPTSALDDLSAQGIVTAVRADLAEIRGAVQMPAPYTVNLSGRRSTVRLQFINNADVPLKIKVQLSSPPGKLIFANSDQPVTLEPGVPTEVLVDVEARSNGTSGVTLDVSTPNDAPLSQPIALEFRVRALGVGNVITGVLFGLVLLWWVQHFRSNWRRRRAAPATLPAS